MQLKCGSRRMVFVTDNYAFKFPKITSWQSLIFGIVENIVERYWYAADGTNYKDQWHTKPLVPIVWADRFGLCVVQRRCTPLTDEQTLQYEDEIEQVVQWTKGMVFSADAVPKNMGLYDGRVCLFDYGYFGVRNSYHCTPLMHIVDGDGKRQDTLYYRWFKFKQFIRNTYKELMKN